MHVVVVGSGIMGLSAAWGLLRQGFQVTVCDRGSIPNKDSASFDAHRLIRFPYGPLTGYRALIPAAYESWGTLWGDLGAVYHVQTGTLVFGSEDSPWLSASLADMASASMDMERLTTDETNRRAPGVTLLSGESAWFSPTGGVLFADRILTHLARHLSELGAAMRPFHQIARADTQSGAIRFSDGSGTRADAIVVCTGSWAPPELAGGGEEAEAGFVPSRQVVRYLTTRKDPWSCIPMLLGMDDEYGFYVVPAVGGTRLKIGSHRFSLEGNPADDRKPTSDESARLDAILSRRLPTLASAVSSDRVCFYAVTPDERFRVSRSGKAWYLRGFSGHGFKFGAMIGLDLASTVAGHHDEAWLRNRLRGEAQIEADSDAAPAQRR